MTNTFKKLHSVGSLCVLTMATTVLVLVVGSVIFHSSLPPTSISSYSQSLSCRICFWLQSLWWQCWWDHPKYTNDDSSIVVNDSHHNNYVSPRPYPTTFSIQFVTNVTTTPAESSSSLSSSSLPSSNDDMVINGTLWYDWSQRAQRIDHGPGSYECVHFYNTTSTQSCTLIFLDDGMYRLLPSTSRHDDANSTNKNHSNRDTQDDVDCCLDLPGIGPPPPDWASSSSSSTKHHLRAGTTKTTTTTPVVSSTWKGPIWDDFAQVVATEWWFDDIVNNINDDDNNNDITPFGGWYDSDDNDYSFLTKLDDGRRRRIEATSIYNFHTMRQVGVIPLQKYNGRDDDDSYAAAANVDDDSNNDDDNDDDDHRRYYGRPLLFTFPGKAMGRQDMHFDYKSMKIGGGSSSSTRTTSSSSVFDLPPGCKNKRCEISTSQKRKQDIKHILLNRT